MTVSNRDVCVGPAARSETRMRGFTAVSRIKTSEYEEEEVVAEGWMEVTTMMLLMMLLLAAQT
jgi:hypothetical protein